MVKKKILHQEKHKEPKKGMFSSLRAWVNNEDSQETKKIPVKDLVKQANEHSPKQTIFKTLQNPSFGVEYFHEQFNAKNKQVIPSLYVNGLTKYYEGSRKPTITNVTFKVMPGQFHAFIGGNGAGKTTTIKSIVGGYSKWNGTIMINGIPNTDPASKKYLGYFPEKATFPQGFSTREYLFWMATMAGISKSEAYKVVEKNLSEIGIKGISKRNPNSFSSGQKKKVLLAQALLTNPSILIMDEPTAMLDPAARKDLFYQINKLREKGKSILISSHVLAELDQFADSITIIEKGRLIYTGSIQEVNKNLAKDLFVLQTDNYKKTVNILRSHKLEVFPHRKNILLKVTDLKRVNNVLKVLPSHGINLMNFHAFTPTLQDVYDRLLKIGHLDGERKVKTTHDEER